MRLHDEEGRLLTLEALRQKVLFHNSIDVWIELCTETGTEWRDTAQYGRFIRYLRDAGLNLQSFNLCAHEAGETHAEKKEFAERLANLKGSDPDYATYTLRLSSKAVQAMREFG